MASITSWNRLEPVVRSDDLAESLRARIHDPLWLLTRQWQLGELRGEDAGSPAVAHLEGVVGHLDRYRPGPLDGAGPVAPLDDRLEPLEALVERRTLGDGGAANLHASVQLLRMLRAAGAGAAVAALDAYAPAAPPPAGARALLTNRLPDAAALRRDLAAAPAGGLPARLSVDAALATLVRDVLTDWAAWFDALVSEPLSPEAEAWDPERLAYAFTVAGEVGGESVSLHAAGYRGGRLDWHAFEEAPDADLGAATGGAAAGSRPFSRTVIPAPVGYGGMPAPRFWELEDARIDLAGLQTAADDLVGLLLVEFALVFGNDWFVIPIDLPAGTLTRVGSLVVDDTFGVRTRVEPSARTDAGGSAWSMFTLGRDAAGDLLFLPPSLATTIDGPVRERVTLARDEIANLAWALEEVVERPDGITERRDDELVDDPPGPPPEGAELVYRAMSRVPTRWIPLVAVGVAGARADHLEVRALPRSEGGAIEPVLPRGSLLRPGQRIHGEEVPREGVRVEWAYQHARWRGGRSVVWGAYRTRIGRGAAYGGLQFDRALAREEAE
jgi:hypothetical protein